MIPNQIFDWLLTWEGGATLTNDPLDSGGVTKYGISQRANPDIDIRNLTYSSAKAIYEQRYWLDAHCDELPRFMQLLVFNVAVNAGVSTSIKLLQRVTKSTRDGKFGPNTLLNVKRYQGTVKSFSINYTSWLLMHYIAIIIKKPTQVKWARGWFRRSIDAAIVANTGENNDR